MLLDAHLVLGFKPERLDGIDTFAVDADREAHKVRVLSDVLLDVEALRELGFVILELEAGTCKKVPTIPAALPLPAPSCRVGSGEGFPDR